MLQSHLVNIGSATLYKLCNPDSEQGLFSLTTLVSNSLVYQICKRDNKLVSDNQYTEVWIKLHFLLFFRLQKLLIQQNQLLSGSLTFVLNPPCNILTQENEPQKTSPDELLYYLCLHIFGVARAWSMKKECIDKAAPFYCCICPLSKR